MAATGRVSGSGQPDFPRLLFTVEACYHIYPATGFLYLHVDEKFCFPALKTEITWYKNENGKTWQFPGTHVPPVCKNNLTCVNR
jgi:hypothetical protein